MDTWVVATERIVANSHPFAGTELVHLGTLVIGFLGADGQKLI